ncbi:hypothetical protein FNF31_02600 [Cafeteria roenbergensis]|uniref:Uncharacterized protein n=4 Tax=Cafeteria roenbergensis TaxID=33653 RepID=A0A5A8DJM9_CAFRO|nr:hypothetical protein FNF31_02600 [Cafeteria roenbergensis]
MLSLARTAEALPSCWAERAARSISVEHTKAICDSLDALFPADPLALAKLAETTRGGLARTSGSATGPLAASGAKPGAAAAAAAAAGAECVPSWQTLAQGVDAHLTGRELSSITEEVWLCIKQYTGKFAAASDAMLTAVQGLRHAGLGGTVLPSHITPLFFLACYDHGSVLDGLTELARVLSRCLSAAREHSRRELRRGLAAFVARDWAKLPLEGGHLPATLRWVKDLPAALCANHEAGCIAEAMVNVAVKVLALDPGAAGLSGRSDFGAQVRVTAGNLPSVKKAHVTSQLIAGLLVALGDLPALEGTASVGKTVGRAARTALGLLSLGNDAVCRCQDDAVLSLLAPLVCTLKVPARPGDTKQQQQQRPSVAARIWGMADEFAVLAAQEQRVFASGEAGELAGVSAAELVVHSAPLVDLEWSDWSLLAPTTANAAAALRIAKAAAAGAPAAVATLLPPEGGQSPAMARMAETFVRRDGPTAAENDRGTQEIGVAVLWVLARRLKSLVETASSAAAARPAALPAPALHAVTARGFLPKAVSGAFGAFHEACNLGIGLNALVSSGEVAFLTGTGTAPWNGYAGQCVLLTSMVGACGVLLAAGRIPANNGEDVECPAPVRLAPGVYTVLRMARTLTHPVSSVEIRNWGAAVAASRIGFAGLWASQHTNHNALWLSADEVDERFGDVESVAEQLPSALAGRGLADGGVASSLVHRMGAHPRLAAHLVQSAFSLLEAVQDVSPFGGAGAQALAMALFAAVVWGFADPEFPWQLVDEPAAEDRLAMLIAGVVSNGCAVWAGSSASGLPSRSAAVQASVYGLSEELVQSCLASMLEAGQGSEGEHAREADATARRRAKEAADSCVLPEAAPVEELGPAVDMVSGHGAVSGGSRGGFSSDQASTLTAFMSENCAEAVRDLAAAIQPDMGRFVERTVQQCFAAKVPLLASATNAGQLVETALQLQVAAGARPGLKMEVVTERLQRAVKRLDRDAWQALRPLTLDRMRAASACMLRASLKPAKAAEAAREAASAGAAPRPAAATRDDDSADGAVAAPRPPVRGAAADDIAAGRAPAVCATVPVGEHATWSAPLRRLCQSVGESLRRAYEGPGPDDESAALAVVEHRSWKAIEANPLLGRGWTCGYDEPGYEDVDEAGGQLPARV